MADYNDNIDDYYGRPYPPQGQGAAYRGDSAYLQGRDEYARASQRDGYGRTYDYQRETDGRQTRRASSGYSNQQQDAYGYGQSRTNSQGGYPQQERPRSTGRETRDAGRYDGRQYADQQYEARRHGAQDRGYYQGQDAAGQYADPYASNRQRSPYGSRDQYADREQYIDSRGAQRLVPVQYGRDSRNANTAQRSPYDSRDRRGGQYTDVQGRSNYRGEGRSSRSNGRTSSPGRMDGFKDAVSSVMPNMDPLSEKFGSFGAALRQDRRLLIALVGSIVLLIAIIVGVASCVLNGNANVVPAVSSATTATTTDIAPVTDTAATNDAAQTAASASTDDAAAATTTATTDAASEAAAKAAQARANEDFSDAPECWTQSILSTDTTTQYYSGTGVDDPWSPTGKFTTGDAQLDQYIKDYCDSYTDPNLDAGDNAYNVYLHISWIDYVERANNQRPWDVEGDWRITYAKQVFEEGYSANCYEFAAVIQYLLRYFGYADAIAEPCFVLRQSGSYGDHGLCFVTSLDGRHSIIDASLSSNGWLLPANSMSYYIDDGYRAS